MKIFKEDGMDGVLGVTDLDDEIPKVTGKGEILSETDRVDTILKKYRVDGVLGM